MSFSQSSGNTKNYQSDDTISHDIQNIFLIENDQNNLSENAQASHGNLRKKL